MTRSIFAAVLIAPLILFPAGALARHHRAADADTAVQNAQAAVPMVTLTPGPGVSFQIPNNWMACEDDTQKLLSSAPDTMNLHDKFCSRSAAVSSVVRAFDPRLFHTMTVIFEYKKDSPLTAKAMDAIQPSDLEQIRGPMCETVLKPMHRAPDSKVDCDVTIGTLAGHRALVSTVVETDPKDDTATFKIVSYEVVYPAGYIQIQFATAQVLEKLVKPTFDAILGSIHFDDTVVPPADSTTAPDGDQTQPATKAPASPDSSI